MTMHKAIHPTRSNIRRSASSFLKHAAIFINSSHGRHDRTVHAAIESPVPVRGPSASTRRILSRSVTPQAGTLPSASTSMQQSIKAAPCRMHAKELRRNPWTRAQAQDSQKSNSRSRLVYALEFATQRRTKGTFSSHAEHVRNRSVPPLHTPPFSEAMVLGILITHLSLCNRDVTSSLLLPRKTLTYPKCAVPFSIPPCCYLLFPCVDDPWSCVMGRVGV